MLQQHNINSGVKLPNCYSHAKFENFLPAIYTDVHHLINVIYYSTVDDVRNTNLHVSKNLNKDEIRYRETENAIKARMEMLFCCV